MDRVKTSIDYKRIRRLLWLVLTLSILFCYLLQSAMGSVHYRIMKQTSATISSPLVIFEEGNCSGASTLYTNKTSAKVNVTAPIRTYDFVDNNVSDVDSSADKGTQSNFTAQQYGPDSVYDKLVEQNTGSTGYNWGITSSAFATTSPHTEYRYMGGTSPNIDNMRVTRLYIRYNGIGTVAIALYTGGLLTDPTGAAKRTEAYNIAVSTGWNTIDVPDYDWLKNTVTWVGWCHGGGNVYYSTNPADCGNFQSTRGRWSQTIPDNADETSAMPNSPGAGSFNDFWYAMYVEYEIVNYEVDLEVQWTNAIYNQTNEMLTICTRKGNNTGSLDATGGYMRIGDGTPDWGSATGTISFWVKMDNSVQGRFWGQDGNMETRWSGTNLILDWGATSSMTSVYSFSANTWYFVAIVWDENNNNLFLYIGDANNSPTLDANSLSGTWTSTTPAPTENRFLNGLGANEPVDGHGEDLRYWNVARSLTEIQSDYNIELTGSEANLRSYFKLNNNFDDIGSNNNDGSGVGSYSFSSDVAFEAPPTENIQVDVWTGSSWQNLFADLANGWNVVSVSSYLNSSTFTIRFKGSTETGDGAQDSWKIDAALLQVWSTETYDYVLEIVNQVADNWTINLSVYYSSNVGRLSSLNISLHDGALSSQIEVSDGSIVKSEGGAYSLVGGVGSTVYISLSNLSAATSGTSSIYAYLKILMPNTSIYMQYIIVFEVI